MGLRRDAGNVDPLAVGENGRAITPAGDDQGLDALRQHLDVLTRLLLDQFRLVVVHRHVGGHVDEAREVGAVEHGQALAGIEYEGHARFLELASVLQHAFSAIGRDDAERQVLRIGDMIEMRVRHRAGMKCGDLVVVQIGGDEACAVKLSGTSRT